jgi:hypothetical protein
LVRKKVALIPALLVLLGLGAAYGGDMVEYVEALSEPPVYVQAVAISAAESTDLATPVRKRLTRKASRVIVSPTFSSATATATLEVVLYQRLNGTDTYSTISLYQAIAAATTSTGGALSGRYPCTDGFLVAPTLSCQVYDVRVVAISAGDLKWTSWTSGLSSVPAGQSAE